MNRRRRSMIVAAVAGMATAKLRAAAPPGRTFIVGSLAAGTVQSMRETHEGFIALLKERGYVEGKNLTFLMRYGQNSYEPLESLAADLVEKKANIIVTAGTVPTQAAMKASRNIPIVAWNVSDPVETGLIASFAKPGGNVTGTANVSIDLAAKRLELLQALAPAARRIGIFYNSENPANRAELEELENARTRVSLELVKFPLRDQAGFERNLKALPGARLDAMYLPLDSVLIPYEERIAGLAIASRIPVIGVVTRAAKVGALASLGIVAAEQRRNVVDYIDRILNGAKPADLPFLRPTQFELVLNKKTAKAIGIEIPAQMLVNAQMVIE